MNSFKDSLVSWFFHLRYVIYFSISLCLLLFLKLPFYLFTMISIALMLIFIFKQYHINNQHNYNQSHNKYDIYHYDHNDNENNNNNECVICLTDYVPNDILSKLICGHLFHKLCFDNWINKKKNTCPLCRHKITKKLITNN